MPTLNKVSERTLIKQTLSELDQAHEEYYSARECGASSVRLESLEHKINHLVAQYDQIRRGK